MNIETFVLMGGIFHIAWAGFDFFWPNIFRWKVSLAGDDLNRILLHIVSKLLVVLYLAIAYVSIFKTQDMIHTELGNHLLMFVVIYWSIRAMMQVHFFGFEKANRLNTVLADYLPIGGRSNKFASYALMLIFFIGIFLYAVPLASLL